jgi:[protein-PII] uridylyltransferase
MSLLEVDNTPNSNSENIRAPLSWIERRELFRALLRITPPKGIDAAELEIYLNGFPEHFWDRLDETDLLWGLETMHLFHGACTDINAPLIRWRELSESRQTRVVLCARDRPGLLAKVGGACSAARLSIVRADIFTRTDNLVLDFFSVVESQGRGPASLTPLQQLEFLVEGALSDPPRFASVWACQRHKYIVTPGVLPLRLSIDNKSSSRATILYLQTADRLGLLYDLLQTISDCGLNIIQADVDTSDDIAQDVFHIVTGDGGKLLDESQIDNLRNALVAAVVLRE